MTPEQLQELSEKAKLWDELSDTLRTIFCGKFERPTVTTLENISNSKTHIDLLEEESKEMVCSEILVKCSSCGNNTKIKYLTSDIL
jgi:hypothetical protein